MNDPGTCPVCKTTTTREELASSSSEHPTDAWGIRNTEVSVVCRHCWSVRWIPQQTLLDYIAEEGS